MADSGRQIYFEDSDAYGRHMEAAAPYPDIIQLEITSVCNLRCIMCPLVTEPRDRKPDERVLALDDIRGMEEIFRHAYEVEMTGFGEIFTHPQLLEILRLFRKWELTINATSNGMLIDEARAEAIVKEGLLDLLCVSLDAARPETYRKIRAGGDLDRITRNLERLSEIKSRLGADLPVLRLSYITMLENLEELPEIVDLAARLKAESVIFQGLNESALTEKQNTARYKDMETAAYIEASARAKRLGVGLEFWYQGSRADQAGIESSDANVRKFR